MCHDLKHSPELLRIGTTVQLAASGFKVELAMAMISRKTGPDVECPTGVAGPKASAFQPCNGGFASSGQARDFGRSSFHEALRRVVRDLCG